MDGASATNKPGSNAPDSVQPHPGFKIELLWRGEDDNLAQKYRDFRIKAVKAKPHDCVETPDELAALPLQYWKDRMAEARATHIIAVRDPEKSSPPVVLVPQNAEDNSKEEWLGIITVLGPQDLPFYSIIDYRQAAWPVFMDPRPLTKGFASGGATFAFVDLFIKPEEEVPDQKKRTHDIGVCLMATATQTVPYIMDHMPVNLSRLRVITRVDTGDKLMLPLMKEAGFKHIICRKYPPQTTDDDVYRAERTAAIFEKRAYQKGD